MGAEMKGDAPMSKNPGEVYVSVTGLRLKSALQYPRFSWHATRSYSQAATAPGNLFTQSKTVDGVHHTLTVWQSREAMVAYLRSGAHLGAMKAYRSLGSGKTCGFYAADKPSWEVALAIWHEHARDGGAGKRTVDVG